MRNKRIFGTSLYKEIGGRHIRANKACEDAVANFCSVDGSIASVALSDGAGSCEHALDGAAIASKVASEMLVEQFDELWALTEDEFAQCIINRVCCELRKKADENSWTMQSMYATLLCAVMHRDGRYMVFHVGDGAVVGYSEKSGGRVISQYEHEYASNITTFINVPGTAYEVRRGTGDYWSFLLTSDGAEPYLFPGGVVTREAYMLQQAGFVLSENETESFMISLTKVLKNDCDAYDDISFALLSNVSMSGYIFNKMNPDLMIWLLSLNRYPKTKKTMGAYVTVIQELQSHPEGVTYDRMARLLHSHSKGRVLKLIQRMFPGDDYIKSSKGRFYLR